MAVVVKSWQWVAIFEELEIYGFYNGSNVDKWCITTVYLPLIKADMVGAKVIHNEHRIRAQPNRIHLAGTPDDLYAIPEFYQGRICGCAISQSEIDDIIELSEVGGLDLPEFLLNGVAVLIHNWMVS